MNSLQKQKFLFPIALDKKNPLAIEEALILLEQESMSTIQMLYKPKSGDVILLKSEKSLVLPIVQVARERKLQLHHELAWALMTNLIPENTTKKSLATSDDEFTPTHFLKSLSSRVL